MEVWIWIAVILGGYLFGGVMFCRLIPLITVKKDICKLTEEGNPGAFSVFSVCGPVLGTICLLLDMFKGFLPVFLGAMFLDSGNMLFAAVVAAPVLGHATGVFNHFRGGKCIATSFGVMLGLLPLTWVGWILAGVYILFSTIVKINPHRRRSVLAFIIFGALSCTILIIGKQYPVAIGCLLLSVIAIVRLGRSPSSDEIAQPQTQNDLQEDDESVTADSDVSR